MKYDHYNVLEKNKSSLCISLGNSSKPYNPVNPLQVSSIVHCVASVVQRVNRRKTRGNWAPQMTICFN